MSETDLSRAIVAAIRLAFPKAKVRRQHSGKVKVQRGWMVLGDEGWPDWLVLLPHGRRVFLEIKREGEKPTAAQVQCHRELRDLGHAVYVVHGVEEAVECVRREVGR